MTVQSEPVDLAALLAMRAADLPDRLAFRDLRNDLSERDRVSYGALQARSLHIAGRLARAAPVGARALIITAHPIDYLAGLFGCVQAGLTAVSGVPAYPPSTRSLRHAARLRRLHAVIEDCDATVLIGPGDLLAQIDETLRPTGRRMSLVATDSLTSVAERPPWRAADGNPGAAAVLQYTSGSTSSPGGVVLTHGNLMSNLSAQAERLAVSHDDVGVSWLPLHHDLGLIGACLLSVHAGFPLILLPPAGFLEQPRRWLQALSTFGGTISWAPNFAYGLCLRSLPPEERTELDLSRWRLALNAAEPIRAETVRAFAPGFAAAGLPGHAMYPAYGLAEATLLVTAPRPGSPPRIVRLDRAALARDRVSLLGKRDSGEAVELVGCGHALPGLRIKIVDPVSGAEAAEDRVGEIWASGPSVSGGYFEGPGGARDGFHGRLANDGIAWLRTGDLGFMLEDELFVTGRLKDVIILRGANIYPQDLEATAAACHPALRDDYACAFAASVNGEEALVLACEAERRAGADAAAAAVAVRRALFEDHGLETHAVVVIPFGAMPMTPSGKVQRKACAQAWRNGELPILFESRAPAAAGGVPPLGAAPSTGPGGDALSWLVSRVGALAPDVAVDARSELSDLGLSSVQVTELAGDIETWFRKRIPAAEVFECRRILDIARRLDQLDGAVRLETGGATNAGSAKAGSG